MIKYAEFKNKHFSMLKRTFCASIIHHNISIFTRPKHKISHIHTQPLNNRNRHLTTFHFYSNSQHDPFCTTHDSKMHLFNANDVLKRSIVSMLSDTPTEFRSRIRFRQNPSLGSFYSRSRRCTVL